MEIFGEKLNKNIIISERNDEKIEYGTKNLFQKGKRSKGNAKVKL